MKLMYLLINVRTLAQVTGKDLQFLHFNVRLTLSLIIYKLKPVTATAIAMLK